MRTLSELAATARVPGCDEISLSHAEYDALRARPDWHVWLNGGFGNPGDRLLGIKITLV